MAGEGRRRLFRAGSVTTRTKTQGAHGNFGFEAEVKAWASTAFARQSVVGDSGMTTIVGAGPG